MKVFLLTLALVALCVFGMCFNIIFRKDGRFPDYEVSKNREMRKRGIKCMHEEEALMRASSSSSKKQNKQICNESCSDCGQTECR